MQPSVRSDRAKLSNHPGLRKALSPLGLALQDAKHRPKPPPRTSSRPRNPNIEPFAKRVTGKAHLFQDPLFNQKYLRI